MALVVLMALMSLMALQDLMALAAWMALMAFMVTYASPGQLLVKSANSPELLEEQILMKNSHSLQWSRPVA